MVLIKNKKGIFFTAFVIVVLSLLAISYTFFSNVADRKTTHNRVDTLNNFVFSVEKDIPRQLKISAFRIIFLLEKEIIESGSYVDDITLSFREAFFNGTIKGETSTEINSIMQGAKFSDIENSLQIDKASKINAEVFLLSPNISITQDDPWNIKIILNTNLIVKDKSNLAIWNRTADFIAYVPINNFEDPLYFINTNGAVTNSIVKDPYNGTYVEGSDVSALYDFSQNSYYKSSNSAPSFLDRLQGLNAPNPNGIESLVRVVSLPSSQQLTKTVVDHIYFSTDPGASCNVLPPGMPSWFRLDAAHISDYQVTCAP